MAFASDDILKRQSDFDFISEFFDNAAIQLALNIDLQVLNNIPGHVSTSNQGNTAGAKSGTFTLGTAAQPLNINRTNVNRLLSAMTGVLGEQNIPNDGRFVVIPPALRVTILNSDLKDSSLTGDSMSIIRKKNYLGNYAGLDFFESNQITPNANGVYTILFGHPVATTYAGQMMQFEGPIVDVSNWLKHYRGRYIYDFAVVQPEALGKAEITIDAN